MELLVRVQDRRSTDTDRDVELTKRGDVIAIHADGHAWSARERFNPEWRILRVPSLTAEDAEQLMAAPEPPGDDKEYVFAKRARRLDLDALNIATKSEARDDGKIGEIDRSTLRGQMRDKLDAIQLRDLIVTPEELRQSKRGR